jgi:hypothetical protein
MRRSSLRAAITLPRHIERSDSSQMTGFSVALSEPTSALDVALDSG